MRRNLNRLSVAANHRAAVDDLRFVYDQIVKQGHTFPVVWHERDSAQKIDRATRIMLSWAKVKGIAITLPNGWK